MSNYSNEDMTHTGLDHKGEQLMNNLQYPISFSRATASIHLVLEHI